MKINFKIVSSFSILAFILTIFFLGLGTVTQYDTRNIVGKKLSDLQINSLSKSYFNKDEFILINFWASWCLPCRKEHKYLLKLKNINKLKIIGINFKDKKQNASKFLKDLDSPYEYLKEDNEGKISIQFGVYGIPESILINKNLMIIKKYIGPINQDNYKEITDIIN